MPKISAQSLKMILEILDAFQVMSCGIGQQDDLHMILVHIILGFVHHDNFVSKAIMSQPVNIFCLS